jgi:RNA polymerase sigma-70 factor, ECF subfamily
MEIEGIYTEFHKSLLAYVKSKIRSKEDAEDILQNVFIRISSNVNKLAEEGKLKSWIFTITRNAIIDYYRANASKKNVAVDLEIEQNLLEEEEADATKGLERCVGSMISLLPEEYRDIIIDSELKGIKQKDLASKYDMAYPSMRSRVQRGRERLKNIFYNCCQIKADHYGNILEAKTQDDCGETCNDCT